jgi:mannose-6-phosphate isomerase-like protein (cupin superfamily)
MMLQLRTCAREGSTSVPGAEMKHVVLTAKRASFKVLMETPSAQAALMSLKPGESTGDPDNEHPRCEQWLYVISGQGKVLAGRQRHSIKAGSLVVIEKREIHQVTATGEEPLVTLNLYVPSAYTKSGEPKKSAE